MRTQFNPTVLSVILSCMLLLIACRHEQIQQFTVDFHYGDGSKESYAMFAGSTLLVHEGDMHVIAKVLSGSKDELELEVTRYTVTHDTIKEEHTIQKAGTNTQKISMTKQAMLDTAGGVQVQPQSMAMIDTGQGPKGACKGNCCEAKCHSIFCCADPDECKNVPCDCKSPPNCNVTHTALQATHFFEIFRSGKDLMVVKS